MVGVKGLLGRLPGPVANVLNPNGRQDGSLRTVPRDTDLFTKTDPAVDGPDCLQDCATCDIKYPAKFSIDESAQLYGQIKAFDRHILVATGRTDWKHTVSDEKGSIAEALDKHGSKISHGATKITTSNIPVPSPPRGTEHTETTTRILVLPAFLYIDNVTPSNTLQVITSVINNTSTNTEPISSSLDYSAPIANGADSSSIPTSPPYTVSSCPHDYLILLCSHKTRDARCGQSAPLLKKELERHLRPLGLLRDLHDERPGGVGIYFTSHVGGHKFSANVFVYRRAGTPGTGSKAQLEETNGHKPASKTGGEGREELQTTQVQLVEAAQCIWLARIRPEDCENLVRYTVLQGKVVKPETQLRGGFDRCKQLASW